MASSIHTANPLRYFDGYATILMERTSAGASVVELVMPHGATAPDHAHDEDETIVLLEGQVTFRVGGEIVQPDECGKLVLPKGVAHAYSVESEDARWLSITASGRYEAFVRAVGRPLDAPVARPLGLADAVAVTVAALENGIELLGPAPKAGPAPRVPSQMERLHAALPVSELSAPLPA